MANDEVVVDIDTRVVWATPVRPDIFLERFSAYNDVFPQITQLRLCHRFGQGSDAIITKLPEELLVEIEEQLTAIAFDSAAKEASYRAAFRCYESRCQPLDHVYKDSDRDLLLGETQSMEHCIVCKNDSYSVLCNQQCSPDSAHKCDTCEVGIEAGQSKRCENTCRFLRDGEMNRLMATRPNTSEVSQLERLGEVSYENHERNEDYWEECAVWFGSFEEPLGKILLSHFGIEATFIDVTVEGVAKAPWPYHRNHHWHSSQHTRPANIATPLLVSMPTPAQATSANRRIRHAMKTFNLLPWIHPRQQELRPEKSLHLEENDKLDRTEMFDQSIIMTRYDEPDAWPKLMVLMNGYADAK